MNWTTRALLGVALAIGAIALPAQAATKRLEGREFVGFLQYANPYFIQGYVGLAPRQGQPLDREAAVTLFVQRLRQGQITNIGPTPVVCNQNNPEGEAAMGLRCGFSIPLQGGGAATQGASSVLRAGDRLRVKIAGVTGSRALTLQPNRTDTVLFDFPIGQAENFLPNGQGNGKGEAPGNQYFQGRIQQIRADSIRGYAVDDLFLAGRRDDGVNIFAVTTVRVRIYKQVDNSNSWSPHAFIEGIDANRNTETPLTQTSPGSVSSAGTAGTWPFGFVANLPAGKRLDEGLVGRTKYYIRLEEAKWRGGGTPIDARVVEFSDASTVPVIRRYDWVRDRNAPAEVQLEGDNGDQRSRGITERLETRALIEREEFFRRTPPWRGESGQLTGRPDRLYGFPGETDHGERGALTMPDPVPTGAASSALTNNPVNLDRMGRARIPDSNARPGEDPSAGGFSRGQTNQVWVEAGDNQNKSYIYEWKYADPSFEKYVTAAFDAESGGKKSRRVRVKEAVDAMRLPPSTGASPTTTTVRTPNAPALGSSASTGSTTRSVSTGSSATTSPVASIDHPQGLIKVFTRGGKPMSWTECDNDADLRTKRETELSVVQTKLTTEFNTYDMPFEIACLSPDQRKQVVDANNQTSGDVSARQGANPFARESRSKTIKVKLMGEWNHAVWDTTPAVRSKLHPLCVTSRYMYELAYVKLKKEFDDRQRSAAASTPTTSTGATPSTTSTASSGTTTPPGGQPPNAATQAQRQQQIAQLAEQIRQLEVEIAQLTSQAAVATANYARARDAAANAGLLQSQSRLDSERVDAFQAMNGINIRLGNSRARLSDLNAQRTRLMGQQ